MGHFYRIGGEPAFTIVGKNGKERDTNIKDARENKLIPSVTTILQIISDFGLNLWINKNNILSALTTTRLPEETDEQFVDRIIEGANEQRDKAADIGKQVHAIIENYITKGQKNESPISLDNVYKWIDANIESAECSKIIVSEDLGCAGELDCLAKMKDGTTAIIDWKTQGSKEKRAMGFYSKWLWQLCGYDKLVLGTNNRLINVAISSTEKDRVEVKEWSFDEIQKGHSIFKSILNIYRTDNNI